MMSSWRNRSASAWGVEWWWLAEELCVACFLNVEGLDRSKNKYIFRAEEGDIYVSQSA